MQTKDGIYEFPEYEVFLFHATLRYCCFTLTQCESVSTFESEVRNSISMLEPHSMDFLGHQNHAKKQSPKIALHFKVLFQSKATLPMSQFITKKYSHNFTYLHQKDS